MKTGLPRQETVMDCPSAMGDRSTSIVASDSADASGFIWSIIGHRAAAPPTAANDPAAMLIKSRRVGSVVLLAKAPFLLKDQILKPSRKNRKIRISWRTCRSPHLCDLSMD